MKIIRWDTSKPHWRRENGRGPNQSGQVDTANPASYPELLTWATDEAASPTGNHSSHPPGAQSPSKHYQVEKKFLLGELWRGKNSNHDNNKMLFLTLQNTTISETMGWPRLRRGEGGMSTLKMLPPKRVVMGPWVPNSFPNNQPVEWSP